MSNLSDFRALVLFCVTDKWQTLQEVADKVRPLAPEWAERPDYIERIDGAMWYWCWRHRVCAEPRSVFNTPIEEWPWRIYSYEAREDYRQAQEADHD